MRNTKQKELILNAVRNHGEHPTADEVYQELKLSYPKLSLATVYRNLNQFADLGELGRVNIDGEPIHFDTCTEEHTHAVCEDCGKILDIYNEDLNKHLSECLNHIDGMADFQVNRADLKFIGRCAACSKKNK